MVTATTPGLGTREQVRSRKLDEGESVDYKTLDIANPTEEHAMLREMVRDWVSSEVEPQALEFDREEVFNLQLLRDMGELGLLGITAPEEYGGAGMDALAATIVHEELSYSDPGFALAYLAHSMLFVNNLSRNGNSSQKQEILPKVCSGEWIGAMAMSEPDVGTDVMSMGTTAQQRDDGDWVINGRKMWIPNGCIDEEGTPCDVVWTYAKTGVKENGRAEISTFIVFADSPGFSVGQKIVDKTGMRGSNTAELVYDDCVVGPDSLVGECGESMIHMMRNLELERLTLAGMSLGIARRCVKEMNRYATEREAFGRPIRDFGQIQRYIGQSFAEWRGMEAYLYNVARQMDVEQSGNRLDSDGIKLVSTTLAKDIADRAMQVMGGYGYVGEYVVERLWRDAKLLEIGGGTLESHQKNITKDLAKDSSILG